MTTISKKNDWNLFLLIAGFPKRESDFPSDESFPIKKRMSNCDKCQKKSRLQLKLFTSVHCQIQFSGHSRSTEVRKGQMVLNFENIMSDSLGFLANLIFIFNEILKYTFLKVCMEKNVFSWWIVTFQLTGGNGAEDFKPNHSAFSRISNCYLDLALGIYHFRVN